MEKARAGDIFAIPIDNGRYGFGQVMLDVEAQCIKPRLVEADSALGFFSGSYLIDVFRRTNSEREWIPSERLIAGIFVSPGLLKAGDWPIVDFAEIDPVKVEFPETFIAVGLASAFRRGEVEIPHPYQEPVLDRLEAFSTVHPSETIVEACEKFGLHEPPSSPAAVEPLPHGAIRGDLRFRPERAEAYRLMGEDPNQSYYEMAMRHGFDLARFYDL